jgi:hypothetical protein
MAYIYDRAFKVGVAIGVMIFFAINFVNYVYAAKEYEKYLNEPIKFAPAARFRWGFPLIWDGYNLGYSWDGTLNALAAILFGIVFGLIFRHFSRKVWS